MTTPDPERQREREYEDEPRVIRDKRRVDPVTGAVREGAATAGPAPTPPPGDRQGTVNENRATGPDDHGTGGEPSEVEALRTQVAERTADLQRLQAEYVNYRRRVERDREAVRELATGGVLLELLPVLDDVGRARDHGELEGPFKAVAEALETAVTKLGLERFGVVGDPFDPTVHEALMHAYSADVSEPTCVQVLQPGYRLGERVLRPARVAVAEPEEAPAPAPEGDPGDGSPVQE